ncbi:MAG: ATP-dependent Clp protease adaptor ClpS [Elusimicrobia bacterium]|nr:ATP-dependent Clp protease adaptor ClpS [Elusimicrobiota bacterium]MDE2512316.1 ATP-dependent Clp protease adaptor ClpS [Elusimicrobiota bacterium]
MPRAAVAAERDKKAAEDSGQGFGEPWRTVLFNCDCHSFDEVERVVMKATRCTLSRARSISNEVHTRGSAVIFDGHKERCEAVADVVAGVGLKVEVVK